MSPHNRCAQFLSSSFGISRNYLGEYNQLKNFKLKNLNFFHHKLLHFIIACVTEPFSNGRGLVLAAGAAAASVGVVRAEWLAHGLPLAPFHDRGYSLAERTGFPCYWYGCQG